MECKLILGLYIFQYAKIKLIREHFTLPARYPRWLSEFNFCCCASNLTKAERPGSCGLQFQRTVHYCEEVKVGTRQQSVSSTLMSSGRGRVGLGVSVPASLLVLTCMFYSYTIQNLLPREWLHHINELN